VQHASDETSTRPGISNDPDAPSTGEIDPKPPVVFMSATADPRPKNVGSEKIVPPFDETQKPASPLPFLFAALPAEAHRVPLDPPL
jgi:hypothetical protein